jgi:hypothetical protein
MCPTALVTLNMREVDRLKVIQVSCRTMVVHLGGGAILKLRVESDSLTRTVLPSQGDFGDGAQKVRIGGDIEA